MNKIATHNSATGEKGKSLLSLILTPFSRCQGKTIEEQYASGCRMFDIRVKNDGIAYRCAHGPWLSRRTATDILSEINGFAERCYVSITYEGSFRSHTSRQDFLLYVASVKAQFRHICWGPVAAKYSDDNLTVDWQNLIPADEFFRNEQAFLPLDGRTWHTFLPIPWLWKKIYFNTPEFKEDIFRFVDFL